MPLQAYEMRSGLPPAGAFDRHLGICTDCVSFLSSYRTTVELGEQALNPVDPVPENVPEGIVAAVIAGIRQK